MPYLIPHARPRDFPSNLQWFDQWFPAFGTITVAIFGLYLLLAAAKGNFKFGTRFFLIKVLCLCGFCVYCFVLQMRLCPSTQVHPMEPGKTLMNSFMFNVSLVLICVLVSLMALSSSLPA